MLHLLASKRRASRSLAINPQLTDMPTHAPTHPRISPQTPPSHSPVDPTCMAPSTALASGPSLCRVFRSHSLVRGTTVYSTGSCLHPLMVSSPSTWLSVASNPCTACSAEGKWVRAAVSGGRTHVCASAGRLGAGACTAGPHARTAAAARREQEPAQARLHSATPPPNPTPTHKTHRHTHTHTPIPVPHPNLQLLALHA